MGETRKPSRLSPTPKGGGAGVPRRRLGFRQDLVPSLTSRKAAEHVSESQVPDWEKGDARKNPLQKRLSLLISLTIGVVLLIAGIGAISDRAGKVGDEEISAPGVDVVVEAREELETGKKAVMAVISAFVGAESMEEKLKWVQRTERIEARMGDYYERHPATVKQIYDFPLITLTQRPEGNFYRAVALTVDNQRMNFALPVTSAGPRIAWESHVGYSEVDWASFNNQRPTEPVEMRLYVQPATFYVPPFEDKAEFLSVELSHPSSQKKAMGYLSKTSTAGIEAMRELMLSGKPEAAVVMAHFSDTTQPIVLIDRFIAAGWLSLGD